MNKRIMVFAPEPKDQEDMAYVLDKYFKENFRDFYPDLQIHKSSAFNEPSEENWLGHWNEGEIFVLIDQRICRDKFRFRYMRGNPKYYQKHSPQFHSFDLSKKLCFEKNIPYLIYQGEITKKQESKLIGKIDSLKDKIKKRLSNDH